MRPSKEVMRCEQMIKSRNHVVLISWDHDVHITTSWNFREKIFLICYGYLASFLQLLSLTFLYVLMLHIFNGLWLSNKLLYHKFMTDKQMIIMLMKRQTIVLCNVWRLAHIQFMHYRKCQPSVFEYSLLTLLHNCFFMIA